MTSKVEFAAFVGIDWADEEHAYYTLTPSGEVERSGKIEQTPEAIASWVADLQTRFGESPVAICLEQTRGPLTYALMQYPNLVLCPINPKQLADYRKAVYPSGAKSDPRDGELLARFLYEHFDRMRPWEPDDEKTRGLRLLTEQRRNWVEDRVALSNELRQRLKETYSLAFDFCGELDSGSFLAFLKKFPSQRELQRASPKQLEKWLPQRRRVVDDPPAEQLLREQIAAIRKARSITKDGPILEHSRLAIIHLVALMQLLNQAIKECDAKIAGLFDKHPDAEIFSSFPGAGPALAPRLTAAFGTDRKKYKDAQDMQQLSGIAPVMKSSGKVTIVHMRHGCPKFLRQTFHEFARCSITKSRWAKAYVEMRKKSGDPFQEVIRGLAFKWQRILFRCWQQRKPYDENKYIQRLRAKNSNLMKFISNTQGITT